MTSSVAAEILAGLHSLLPVISLRHGATMLPKGVSKHGDKYRIDTRANGKRVRSPSFARPEEAERWGVAHGIVDEVVSRHPQGATVADALTYYAEHVESGPPRLHLARLKAAMGDVPAVSVRKEHVGDYRRDRVAEGASEKTAWNELVTLRAALRFAWENDKVHQPPRFKLPKPDSVRDTVCWEEEAPDLLNHADLPLLRALLAMWCCGMRRGEVLAARWEWVQQGVLVLPKHVVKGKRKQKRVALPAELLALLRLAPRHPEYLFAKWGSTNGKGRQWPQRYYASTLQREWKRCREAAGRPDLRLHDMRRSFSSVAQVRRHPRAAVMKAGGWSRPETMEIHYSHAQQAAAAEVARDLIGAVAPRLRLMAGGQG